MKRVVSLLLALVVALLPTAAFAAVSLEDMWEYRQNVRYFWEQDIHVFMSAPPGNVAQTEKGLMNYKVTIADGSEFSPAIISFTGFVRESSDSAYSTGFNSYPEHRVYVNPGAAIAVTAENGTAAYDILVHSVRSEEADVTVSAGNPFTFSQEGIYDAYIRTPQGVPILVFMVSVVGAASGEQLPPTTPSALTSFRDVPAGAWYEKEVAAAEKNGIITGKGKNQFDPEGALSVAEAVTLAAKTRALYENYIIDADPDGGLWYTPYLEYALKNGILKKDTFKYYDKIISREEMAHIFSHVLPVAEYSRAFNETLPLAPDVEDSRYRADIDQLYRCRIVSGTNDSGWFYPEKSISRAETAAIINRIAALTAYRDSVKGNETNSKVVNSFE